MRTLLVCLLALTWSPAAAQQTASAGFDQIVTAGEGVVQAVPDRAFVTISAESRASNARDAQRRNAEAMRPVQDRLRASGLPADAIRTLAYDLQYEWDFVDGRRVGRGYVARNTIEVRIDTVDRVGELLEIAVTGGATSVSGVRFDLKEQAAHEREALRRAVADARAKADAAATAAGRTLGRVVRIEERGAADAPMAVRSLAMREVAQADAAPPIAAGQIELRAGVTLVSTLD